MSFLLAAALAAVSSPSPSPSPSPSAIPQIAHVVTSDRGSESAARAARTTYVVTADEIARDGYRTVADALASVPGVEVQRYGAFGAEANVGIRGSSNEQVLVLLNGLPVAGAQIENVNLEQYGVAGVERIEVVEGGGSTLYGSGSIGGVINIITNGEAPSTATLSTGSFDEQSYQLQTPYLSFQRTYAGNAYPLPGGTTRPNSAAELTAGTLTFSHPAGAFDLDLLADASDAALGTPGTLPPYISQTSRQETLAHDLRLRAEKRSKHATLDISLGASSQSLNYTCDTPVDTTCYNVEPTPAPSGTAPPYEQLLTDDRTMLSVSNSVGDDRARLVYGVDLSRGNARIDGGTGFYSPTLFTSAIVTNAYAQTAAYLQSQWFWPNGGELYAGLRGERDLDQLATAQGSALSPSLGGIVAIGPHVQLKLNAATAFRAPTADELFYPPQGVDSNDGLVPERTRVGDATFVTEGAFGRMSLGWFATLGSNLIADANPAAYDFEPVNVGHASIEGFTYSFDAPAYRHVVATLGVTDLYRALDLDTGTRIEGRGPVLSANAGLRYVTSAASRFDGFGANVSSNGVSEAPLVYLPYTSTVIPWYARSAASTTVGAYGGWRVAPRLVLTLRGFNLLDDRYAVYNGYPMPGRSFALELRSR
ncbi:MAG TPA: TonB-dependent receptor [Verrucomicrobiae bacterium]|nr:TonB-dependent receptor [Verrucomicrobiae bacterium]